MSAIFRHQSGAVQLEIDKLSASKKTDLAIAF